MDRELKGAIGGRRIAWNTFPVSRGVVYLFSQTDGVIVLLSASKGNGPRYILIPDESAMALNGALIAGKGCLLSERGAIRDLDGTIIIDTAGAAEWDPSLRFGGWAPPEDVGRAFGALLDSVKNRTAGIGLLRLVGFDDRLFNDREEIPVGGGNLFPRKIANRIKRFARSLLMGDSSEVAGSIAGIIGLGDGLTPSCDDMLVGLIGLLFGAMSDPSGGALARDILSSVSDPVNREAWRTTPVSAHFLREAARGRFAERVKNLIESVFSGAEKEVEGAVERVLEYGATSGADLIAGMVLGRRILAERQRIQGESYGQIQNVRSYPTLK